MDIAKTFLQVLNGTQTIDVVDLDRQLFEDLKIRMANINVSNVLRTTFVLCFRHMCSFRMYWYDVCVYIIKVTVHIYTYIII